jgi:hypothetical protein
MFQLADKESFLTTVGKLNFFRWAIEKGVLDYIKLNLAKIEKEMNANAREMQRLFLELRDKYNQAFLIVTHNEELAALGNRTLHMKDGLMA